jgi:hypothetical protein
VLSTGSYEDMLDPVLRIRWVWWLLPCALVGCVFGLGAQVCSGAASSYLQAPLFPENKLIW